MAVGERLTLVVEKLVHGGDGLARHGRHVVFLPGVLPGETVTVEVARAGKGYVEARLVSVDAASPLRVSPLCPVFGDCGGCQLQHAAHEHQAELRLAVLREDFRRIGRLAIEPEPVLASPVPYGYRRRARLKVFHQHGRPRFGFMARASHRIVPIESCPILHPRLNDALTALTQVLNHLPLPSLREVGLQYADHEDQAVITLTTDREPRDRLEAVEAALRAALHGLAGLIAYNGVGTRVVFGLDYLVDHLRTMSLRVSDRAFLQIHRDMNEALLDQVLAMADLHGRERVGELHCGIGNLTLFLAQQAQAVVAVDSSGYALADARLNAESNGIKNIEFFQYDTTTHLKKILEAFRGLDCLVVDPPREGLSAELLDGLAGLGSSRVVYISCEPATLARDLRRWSHRGYAVARIRPLDMFPQTAHLEVIAALDARGAGATPQPSPAERPPG